MRLVVVARLAGRPGRRARAKVLEVARRRGRDVAGEPLGLLPSTSMLGRISLERDRLPDGEDRVGRSGKIDEN